MWSRLDYFRSLKRKRLSEQTPLRVGVLGCMAERLKKKLLETDKMVDLVAGPGMYVYIISSFKICPCTTSVGGGWGHCLRFTYVRIVCFSINVVLCVIL